jgi:hypothetical protein
VEQGSLAGKITGMLLHGLDNSELVQRNDGEAALQSKIQEALAVLEAYHQTKVAPMVPVARTVQRAPLSRSQLEQSKLPPSPLPVYAARAHNRCVKTPNVNAWWKRGRKEFYGRGNRGALQDKSGCGECFVC